MRMQFSLEETLVEKIIDFLHACKAEKRDWKSTEAGRIIREIKNQFEHDYAGKNLKIDL